MNVTLDSVQDSEDGSGSDEVFRTKLVVLLLLALLSIVSGLLPLALHVSTSLWYERRQLGRRMSLLRRNTALIISCLLCASAGVLFATVMIHMVPEVRHVLAEAHVPATATAVDVPLAELAVCVGFFLVFFVEQLAHMLMLKRRMRVAYHHSHSHPHPHNQHHTDSELETTQPAPLNSNSMCGAACVTGAKTKTGTTAGTTAGATVGATEEAKTGTVMSHQSRAAAPATVDGPNSAQAPHAQHGADISGLHVLRAVLVVLALSVHSVFEGVAIGLENETADVWLLFVGIVGHKVVVIFCIGQQLLNTKKSSSFIVLMVSILSLASPVGVALTMFAAQMNDGGSSGSAGTPLVSGILQGLAAGTLIYVIFFELLAPELHEATPGLVRVFTVALGFCLMLALQLTTGHSHSHHPADLSHHHPQDQHHHDHHDHHDHQDHNHHGHQ